MNKDDLRNRLGIPPGETLTALVALAEEILPGAPWDAFKPLWLSLPWLKPAIAAHEIWYGTPRNVHPFAETGGDHNHFGFLMDRDLPTDERPIVFVYPTDDDDVTQIVAPNLRDFLGLVAISFAEVVSRSPTDAEWFRVRTDWYGDDTERLQEMARLSDALCTIPGVSRPASPSRVANAYPDQAFRKVIDGEEDVPERPRPADFKGNLDDACQATRFAQLALDEQRFAEAIHHARCGMLHPAYTARCMYLLATACRRAGGKGAAKRVAEDLLAAWLDTSPILPPGVHPRKAIDRDELIALLDEVEGSQAAAPIQRVRDAPELEEPVGDYL